MLHEGILLGLVIASGLLPTEAPGLPIVHSKTVIYTGTQNQDSNSALRTGTISRVMDAPSGPLSISGRLVAFESADPGLVPDKNNICRRWWGDYSCQDVFVFDVDSRQIRRVSVSTHGGQSDDHSSGPSLSADGRFVAFTSGASNLAPGGTRTCFASYVGEYNCSNVYVHDLLTRETHRISSTPGGSPGNGNSKSARISGDGRYVTFESTANDLIPGPKVDCLLKSEQGRCFQVYLHDRVTGQTSLVSAAPDGRPGDGSSTQADLAHDGRYVVFSSVAGDLLTDRRFDCWDPLPRCHQIYVRDLALGQTSMVSVSPSGDRGNHYSLAPRISGDGRRVVFTSRATNFGAEHWDDLPPFWVASLDPQVFVRDLQKGVTTRVSSAFDQGRSLGSSSSAGISSDGQYVAFASEALNLVSDPTDICRAEQQSGDRICSHIYLYSQETRRVTRISLAPDGTQGDGHSTDPPAISPDGRLVVFSSSARNLVPGDMGKTPGFFLYDRLGGELGSSIYASPPRCQLANAAGTCSVSIQIRNGRGLPVQLWVREADGSEKQVTGTFTATEFSQEAPWIQAGSKLFLLYEERASGRLLLDSLIVRGELPAHLLPEIVALPGSCIVPPGQFHCTVRLQISNPAFVPLQVGGAANIPEEH